MPTLLVTGGSGMIAQHVAEAASRHGCTVRLADLEWRPEQVWAPAHEKLTLDIRDTDGCRRAADGVDAIVHCAAVVGPERARRNALLTVDVNVSGTAGLLEAASAVGARFINVSTATLYGNRPDLNPLRETDAADPLTVYDGTKLMAEIYCSVHRRTYGSDAASFRTGFVFGRGTQIGEYFIPRVLKDEAITESVGADHPCDFTYVVDLAEALVAATFAPRLSHTVYNVTGGRCRTRGELAQSVRSLLPTARIQQGPGIDPKRHLRGPAVLDRAREDFGWQPRFDLESGLADWLQRLGVRP